MKPVQLKRGRMFRTSMFAWVCIEPQRRKHFWSWVEDLGGSCGKVSVYNARDLSSVPGSGSIPVEGNGNPLLYSCLENPRDGGAWWAAAYGVTQGRTRLNRLSSSSSRGRPRDLPGQGKTWILNARKHVCSPQCGLSCFSLNHLPFFTFIP